MPSRAIFLTINLDIKKRRPPVIKTFRDDFSPCTSLSCLKKWLLDIISTDDVNIQVIILTAVIRSSIDMLAPYVTRTVKRAISDKNNAYQALKIKRNDFAFQKDYKVKKKTAELLIQCAKIQK